MERNAETHEVAFHTQNRNECREMHLVLQAAGIGSQATHHNGQWALIVRRSDLSRAQGELDSYREENPAAGPAHRIESPDHGGSMIGVLVYAVMVLAVAAINGPIGQSRWGIDASLVPAGEMQAGKVTDGEWWRTITALTLHADAGHVAANLAFGALFGILAGRVLGGGVAWLTIVLSGALGNLANAILREPDHSSIGASTAVFAALGLLVVHALRPRATQDERLLKRWSPLIGGVVLLGITGVGGPRTDTLAHLMGFVAGMVVGWLACRVPSSWLSSQRVQLASATLTLVLVAAAWWVALAMSGGRAGE